MVHQEINQMFIKRFVQDLEDEYMEGHQKNSQTSWAFHKDPQGSGNKTAEINGDAEVIALKLPC